MPANEAVKLKSADTLKLGSAVILLVLGLVGFYFFSQYPQYLRVISLLGMSGLAIWIGLSTELGMATLGLVRESKSEVQKVVWPTKQETIQSTMLVLALVFLVGIFLWLIDMALFWLITILTGNRV